MLGYYYYGIGSDADKQKAIRLYQRAANLGNVSAQCNLGNLYKKGDGIEKNIDKAIYWYEKSAKQDYQDAKSNLDKLLNSE